MAIPSMEPGQAVGGGLFVRSEMAYSIVVDVGRGIRLSCIVTAIVGDAQSFRETAVAASHSTAG
jgi:hypothetical protein